MKLILGVRFPLTLVGDSGVSHVQGRELVIVFLRRLAVAEVHTLLLREFFVELLPSMRVDGPSYKLAERVFLGEKRRRKEDDIILF